WTPFFPAKPADSSAPRPSATRAPGRCCGTEPVVSAAASAASAARRPATSLSPTVPAAQDAAMSKLSFRVAALLLPVVLGTPIVGASAQEADGDVTIYRCTGADGQVVIGNIPCADGSEQQVRSMVRPVDGTPTPRVATPAPAPPPATPEVGYVQVQPPQPLYECIR